MEGLFVPHMDGHPSVASDVLGDLYIWMLNQRCLLLKRRFHADHRALDTAEAKDLALGSHLEHGIPPRVVFKRSWIGQAIGADLPEGFLGIHFTILCDAELRRQLLSDQGHLIPNELNLVSFEF